MKDFLEKFEENLMSFLLGSMTLITVINVFVRYVLKSNIVWAMEYSILAFGWLIILGGAWCVRVGGHIGIDTIVNLFPNKVARTISAIACLFCIAYGLIILIGSWTYVKKIYSIGIMSQDIQWLPQWMPRTVMVIGYGLIVLRFTEIFIKIIKGEQRGLGLMNEAKEAIDSIKINKKY
jgi:C4-dicarboxylate transporter, DctQ subunit